MIFWKNRIFREYLAGRSYLRDTREIQMCPSYPDSSYSNHARHMHHFARCLLTSYPRKYFSLQFALSLHTLSLSHTTLTNKSHMKYRVHSIEHNYNQIWHGIKANKTHSCKLQLYKKGYQASDIISPMFEWIHCQTQRCTVFF